MLVYKFELHDLACFEINTTSSFDETLNPSLFFESIGITVARAHGRWWSGNFRFLSSIFPSLER